jgi:hypothetical protein
MSAAKRREPLPSGGASGVGFQYRRSMSARIVEIVMPAPPPAAVMNSLAAAATR